MNEAAASGRDDTALPLVHELAPAPDPEEVFCKLADWPHCVFFDSALRHPELGRYSFIAADPFDYFEEPVLGQYTDPLGPSEKLARRMRRFATATIPELPPFQGGAAGLFSYDLGRSFERVPSPKFDEFKLPALAIGFYDVVVAFDHAQRRAWVISQGFPETEPALRRKLAEARLSDVLSDLETPAAENPGPISAGTPRAWPDLVEFSSQPEPACPQYETGWQPWLTSNFTAEGYRAAVQRAIDYIHAGDVFQVNLSQRLLYPATDDSVSLYLRLRKRNAATFAGYFDLGDFQICSASPERFVQVRGRQVEARPIKGTRKRTEQPEADLYRGDDLQESEKDRAENVMIVDLLRNDLSRVCRPESVRVTQLCGLENYAFVQHLVSVVRGELDPRFAPLDLLRGAFPGGSITGAPKVRAMEIIAELEPTARGAYCGSLGYLGFDGTLDTSILIRTVTAGRGWWQFPVGGGIVAQSDPAAELAETWHKAEGMLRALR